MTSVVVDARFAGGLIMVESDAEYLGDEAVVVLDLPGCSVALFPREARKLAAALVDVAAQGPGGGR